MKTARLLWIELGGLALLTLNSQRMRQPEPYYVSAAIASRSRFFARDRTRFRRW
jgi:hypothetical protein